MSKRTLLFVAGVALVVAVLAALTLTGIWPEALNLLVLLAGVGLPALLIVATAGALKDEPETEKDEGK